MPKTLRLLREEITYSKAQREEVDISIDFSITIDSVNSLPASPTI